MIQKRYVLIIISALLFSNKVLSQDNVQVLNYNKTYIRLIFKASDSSIIATKEFHPNGNIIDDWQRIIGEFTIPQLTTSLSIELVNDNQDIQAFFDDIRIHPINGNMKSFVYDPVTQRLMAELDENNYATYYEYDKEGGLVRVKKETEKGVFTIQETRSKNVIKNPN